jgi:hypothetical protein
MADDTYSRGYRNDHHDRGGAGAPDPLTELARLIGQSDPFAVDPNRRPDRRQADPHPQPSDWRTGPAQQPQPYGTGTHDDHHGGASEPQHYADGTHGSAEQYSADQNGYAYPQAAQHEAGYDSHGEPQPYHQDHQAYQPDQQAYQHEQAYQQDEQAYTQDQQAYQDQPTYPQSEPPYHGQASVAPEQGGPGEQGDPAALHPDQHGGYPAPPFFGDPNARPDDYYDDAPAPRRGWVVTAAALVGLAVVGTAGAFAYRAVFTGGETRIITRDVGPSKITPAQTSQDSANKPGDRLAAAGQNERLGPPPEQPIAIPEPPRTVPPALGLNQPPAPATPVLPGPPSLANPPADAASPPARVVRTQRVKPDEVLGDAGATRPAAQPRVGAPSVQPPQPRVVPPAQSAANAPLSLAPQGGPNTAAPGPAPPPHTTAVASTGPAVERSSGGAGWYVQVSAQKSEDEAKSSFRGIQARHASLLGGQQLVIRRKDLGTKGTFYGAQVGPFGSREAATKLCEDLKAAGQSCMAERH